MTIKNHCNSLRTELRSLGNGIKSTKEHADGLIDPVRDNVDKSEVLANLTLAFRHVEDAIMRLGKTIQALDGGVSCYDETAKRPAVGPMEQHRRNVETATGCGGKVLHQATIRGEDFSTLVPVPPYHDECHNKAQSGDRRIESPDPKPTPFCACTAKSYSP